MQTLKPTVQTTNEEALTLVYEHLLDLLWEVQQDSALHCHKPKLNREIAEFQHNYPEIVKSISSKRNN